MKWKPVTTPPPLLSLGFEFFINFFLCVGISKPQPKANTEEATVVDETPNGELEKCKSENSIHYHSSVNNKL